MYELHYPLAICFKAEASAFVVSFLVYAFIEPFALNAAYDASMLANSLLTIDSNVGMSRLTNCSKDIRPSSNFEAFNISCMIRSDCLSILARSFCTDFLELLKLTANE